VLAALIVRKKCPFLSNNAYAFLRISPEQLASGQSLYNVFPAVGVTGVFA
jgi:hypothetical protein